MLFSWKDLEIFTYEDKDRIYLLDFITELVLFNQKNRLVLIVGLRQVFFVVVLVLASSPLTFTGLFCFHLVAEQWCSLLLARSSHTKTRTWIHQLDFITELVLFNWKNLLVHVAGLRQVQLLLVFVVVQWCIWC